MNLRTLQEPQFHEPQLKITQGQVVAASTFLCDAELYQKNEASINS